MFYRKWKIRNVVVLDVWYAAHLEGFLIKQGMLFLHVSNVLGMCRACRWQLLWSIKQRSYSRFTFNENTTSNLPEVSRSLQVSGKSLFCFSSIWKFASSKNPFETITSLSELYFRFRRSILLVETKTWFLWIMAAAQAAENHGTEWGLTW